LIIKFLSKTFALLNGEVSPRQIALGFAYGAIIGLLPANGPLPYVLILLSFIINFNLVAVGLSAAIAKIQSFFIDSLANSIGYYFLTQIPGLKGFWTALYNMPIVAFTRFNNTIVLGSLIIGIAFFIPNYFFIRGLVKLYRVRLRDQVMRFKIVSIVKASSFYKYYVSFKGITGD